jgi:hypothetical protein
MIHASSFILRSPIWLVVAAAATLSASVACSTPVEPADPGGTGGTGATGGGAGTGAGGMASGGMATGGMAAGGMAGTGTAPITTGPLPDVGCNYTNVITLSCAIAGCHRKLEKSGGLDFGLDDAFRSRFVDVPAQHIQIDCDPTATGYLECVPPPATCPPPGVAKLIDRAAPAESWVLKKLDGGASCGDAMPLAPGDDPVKTGWGADAKTCLQNFFLALANNR